MAAFGIAAARSETMPEAVTRRKPTRQLPFERQRASSLPARKSPAPSGDAKQGAATATASGRGIWWRNIWRYAGIRAGFEALARRGQEKAGERERNSITKTKGGEHAHTKGASCGKSRQVSPPAIATVAKTGWTRTGAEGGKLTVCLLDREPVLADMTGCDRFELREPA